MQGMRGLVAYAVTAVIAITYQPYIFGRKLVVSVPLLLVTTPAQLSKKGGITMGFINPMLHHNESEWSSERPEAYEYHAQGKSIALWISVVMLAAVLGALVYYAYRTVKTQDVRITQIFGNQGTLTTLGQRADAAESKLHDLTGG